MQSMNLIFLVQLGHLFAKNKNINEKASFTFGSTQNENEILIGIAPI